VASAALSNLTRTQLVSLGVGMAGGAVVLGGVLWLLQRQIEQGKVLRVRMVHELSPTAEQQMNRFLEALAPIAERGAIDVNLRFFPRRLAPGAE